AAASYDGALAVVACRVHELSAGAFNIGRPALSLIELRREIFLCESVARRGRFLVQLACFGVILHATEAILVKPSQIVETEIVSSCSGLLIQLACLGVVFGNALSVFVEDTEAIHAKTIADHDGLLEPLA